MNLYIIKTDKTDYYTNDYSLKDALNKSKKIHLAPADINGIRTTSYCYYIS
jgi:hypothetical protein